MDPRIPDNLESLFVEIETNLPVKNIDWYMDGTIFAQTSNGVTKVAWPLCQGWHHINARIWFEQQTVPHQSEDIRFFVKGQTMPLS